MLTFAEQEAMRAQALSEVGTMPPCPMCQRPRVQRSDYVRCNPCGMNWLNGEDITRDARLSRAPLPGIKPSKSETNGGA